MKLFHGSKHQFDAIKRKQAAMPNDVEVPKGELQNKIYFTPDIGFAIAMAAGPDGMTSIIKGTVSFENYDKFDPERTVYVYEVDSTTIPDELIEQVDKEQIAVDLDEIKPSDVHTFKAKDVFEHYEWTEWKHPNSLPE